MEKKPCFEGGKHDLSEILSWRKKNQPLWYSLWVKETFRRFPIEEKPNVKTKQTGEGEKPWCQCYRTWECSKWRRCWLVKGPVCPGLKLISSKAVSRMEKQIQFYWITSACRAQSRLCDTIPVLHMKVCPVPRSERVFCAGLVFLSSFWVSWWGKRWPLLEIEKFLAVF